MSLRAERLLRRLLVVIIAPAAVAFGGFGFMANWVARRALEDEVGRRLGAAAVGVALTIVPEQVTALGAGDEQSRTYGNVFAKLEAARVRAGLRRVMLVARDLTGRGDTDTRVALGAPAHELAADAPEIARALDGLPSASPLFIGHDGRPYKRAYAVVGPFGPPAVGFVVVEGTADVYTPLARFRAWLVGWGALALGGLMLLTTLMARRITRPLSRLAAAAERMGQGRLDEPVAPETRDEIGALAVRLDDMRSALRARDERLRMMLAGIAHEVRNPLGGLELFAGLLREGLDGQPDRLAEVARIEREIGHLKRVVSEFLDYARRPPLEWADVALRPLLTEVAEMAVGGAGAAPVVLELGFGVDGATVRGDATQLRRVLLNLLSNARTAAGEAGRVVLAARLTDAQVVIEVRDSGPGIPEPQHEAVFAPFFTTRAQGTGLGLAFVRDIVRDHGGVVRVGRALEGGALLQVELPRAL